MTEAFDSNTPSGRFMLTILGGVAGLERANILQRMSAGTDRAVRGGMWSGVVPYGFVRVGEKRHARLVVADTPLLGLTLCEADVVKLIFRLSADEGKSCAAIATHLNNLCIPTAYLIPGHATGRRKRNTAGVWRPGRVRHVLVNPTYKGIHVYGKHAKKKRELIEREVPAIVDAETWARAQETLRKNTIWSPRNGKRDYLLRGLMKCSLCHLTLLAATITGTNPTTSAAGSTAPRARSGRRAASAPAARFPAISKRWSGRTSPASFATPAPCCRRSPPASRTPPARPRPSEGTPDRRACPREEGEGAAERRHPLPPGADRRRHPRPATDRSRGRAGRTRRGAQSSPCSSPGDRGGCRPTSNRPRRCSRA